MDLETKLKNFKEWMTIHYLKQSDDLIYRQETESKRDRFYNILVISNRLELIEARNDVLPYIQYGLLFNGGNLVYFTENANKLSQKKFNEVLLFNILQFVAGAYIRNKSFHVGSAALMLSVYGFISNTPKYATTRRGKLDVEYAMNPEGFEIFYPVEGILEFVLMEYLNNRLHFPEQSPFKWEPIGGEDFNTPLGIILNLNCQYAYVNMSVGYYAEKIPIKRVYLKENGILRKTTLRNKDSKELRELKEVFDALVGE